MFRRLAPLLLAPLLGSCQPPEIVVRAVFLGGALAFVPADGDDKALCWKEGLVVDDRLKPSWHFTAAGTGECRSLFPLVYGRAPAGADDLEAPSPLEPGRLYLFEGNVIGPVSGAFALSRAGAGLMVHNVDPDSPAAAALRDRWWTRRYAVPAR
jgi:hypothetical protein